MIQNLLSKHADEAAARYALLADSWQANFTRAMNDLDFGTSSHTAAFINAAQDAGNIFIEQELAIGKMIFDEIATEAHQATLNEISSNDAKVLTERVTEHLRASLEYVAMQLLAQILRDVTLLRQKMQRVALETFAASRSRGISQRAAMLEYRIGSSTEMDFSFYDRAGRKWHSRKFVRAIWRHTLLSAYNETVMLTLADHGISRARVVHENANADAHNTIISFGANTMHATYSEIAEAVFHPNSNAILAMESDYVSS